MAGICRWEREPELDGSPHGLGFAGHECPSQELRSRLSMLQQVPLEWTRHCEPERSERRSNPETIPGLLRSCGPRNDESPGSISAKPSLAMQAKPRQRSNERG